MASMAPTSTICYDRIAIRAGLIFNVNDKIASVRLVYNDKKRPASASLAGGAPSALMFSSISTNTKSVAAAVIYVKIFYDPHNPSSRDRKETSPSTENHVGYLARSPITVRFQKPK
jgi:hypothetical protein